MYSSVLAFGIRCSSSVKTGSSAEQVVMATVWDSCDITCRLYIKSHTATEIMEWIVF